MLSVVLPLLNSLSDCIKVTRFWKIAIDGIENIRQRESSKWNLWFMHHCFYFAQGIDLSLECHASEMDSPSNTVILLTNVLIANKEDQACLMIASCFWKQRTVIYKKCINPWCFKEVQFPAVLQNAEQAVQRSQEGQVSAVRESENSNHAAPGLTK